MFSKRNTLLIANMISMSLSCYTNTHENLGEFEKAVETLDCGSCFHSICCSVQHCKWFLTTNDPQIGPQMIPDLNASDPAGKWGMAWSLVQYADHHYHRLHHRHHHHYYYTKLHLRLLLSLLLLLTFTYCQWASRAKTQAWWGSSIIEPCKSTAQVEKLPGDWETFL